MRMADTTVSKYSQEKKKKNPDSIPGNYNLLLNRDVKIISFNGDVHLPHVHGHG